MSRVLSSLGDLIRKALLSEGRASRKNLYKRSRRQREKNRVRQVRRQSRLLTRALRPTK